MEPVGNRIFLHRSARFFSRIRLKSQPLAMMIAFAVSIHGLQTFFSSFLMCAASSYSRSALSIRSILFPIPSVPKTYPTPMVKKTPDFPRAIFTFNLRADRRTFSNHSPTRHNSRSAQLIGTKIRDCN